MTRIHVATSGPSDWRQRLASPDRHWKRGRSAFELAVSWENASRSRDGLPAEVRGLLSSDVQLKGSKLLFAAVEHKVALPGGSRPSQNDLWALLLSPPGILWSLTVEGKAGELFDKTVAEWLSEAKADSRKPERLAYLQSTLGLDDAIPGQLRYQLFHRAASALIEARRCSARAAAMLVQSFASDPVSEDDFRAFSRFLGLEVAPGELREVRVIDGIPLYIGWISSEPASDQAVEAFLATEA